jgi:hypothetical protein
MDNCSENKTHRHDVREVTGALKVHAVASDVGLILYELMEDTGYTTDEIRHAAVYMISQANSADLLIDK